MATNYTTGTVTLTNGSTAILGVGTAWAIAQIAGGVIFAESAGGNAMPILSVIDDTHITSSIKWQGATGTYAYVLVPDTAYLQQLSRNTTVLAQLLAGLQAGTLFKYDVSGTLAAKATYDTKPKGFAYLSIDTNPAQLYIKRSDTAGDWAGPFTYGQGQKGDTGSTPGLSFSQVITGAPGSAASLSVSGNNPYNLTFTIPAGQKGVNPRGTYSAGAAYAVADSVLYGGSTWYALQATTGNAPPSLPTTSNAYWYLLAQAGAAAGGAGDMLKATYDPQNIAGDAFNRANHSGDYPDQIIDYLPNGDFSVWQRGNSVNISSGVGFFADTWRRLTDYTGSVVNATKMPFGVFAETLPGNPKFYCSITKSVVGSGGSYDTLRSTIEGVSTLAGRRVTMTLYARIQTISPVLPSIQFRQNFGTGGSPSPTVTTILATNVALLSGANFVKLQYVFDVPSIAGMTIGTAGNDCLELFIFLPPSATYVIELVKASVVKGDASKRPDPAPPRPEWLTRIICQRYYERVGIIFSSSAAQNLNTAYWKVPKRAVPTLSILTTSGTGATVADLVSPGSDPGSIGIYQATANSVLTGAVVEGSADL